MDKYEYKIIDLDIADDESWNNELNRLGKGGWELVNVVSIFYKMGITGKPKIKCFLKRKI